MFELSDEEVKYCMKKMNSVQLIIKLFAHKKKISLETNSQNRTRKTFPNIKIQIQFRNVENIRNNNFDDICLGTELNWRMKFSVNIEDRKGTQPTLRAITSSVHQKKCTQKILSDFRQNQTHIR